MRRYKEKRMHWLANLINNRRFKVGVEVGAATGLTTSHILANCPSLTTLYVVDDWRIVVPPGHPSYYEGHPWSLDTMEQEFLKKVGDNPKLKILKGLSWEMARTVEDGSLDFAFIDASHDYDSVMKDLKAWHPKVRKGGVVCGHDINIVEGVRKAVAEFYGSYIETRIDHVWSKEV